MQIGEVEQQTGLPRKTIRFYESKGLLSVERSENSYREYDEAMVKRLKTIAIFRRAGISIADIQLWCDNVISTEEMLKKRLHELKDSVDTASDQLMLCRNLMSGVQKRLKARYGEIRRTHENDPHYSSSPSCICSTSTYSSTFSMNRWPSRCSVSWQKHCATMPSPSRSNQLPKRSCARIFAHVGRVT